MSEYTKRIRSRNKQQSIDSNRRAFGEKVVSPCSNRAEYLQMARFVHYTGLVSVLTGTISSIEVKAGTWHTDPPKKSNVNIEETHGDLNSQNQVKLEATSFVQRSAAAIGRKQTKESITCRSGYRGHNLSVVR